MGKLGGVIAIGALLAACSDKAPAANSELRPNPVPRAKAALSAPESDPRFDGQGNLRPGTLKLAWFEIPMGFERVPGSTERIGNFEATGITPAQLRAYVDARGTPGNVQYMTHGEIFTKLAPNHTKLPLPPVDVTILIVDVHTNKLRLVVEDHAPTGEPTLTPQQAMDKLAKARDRTE